LGIPPFFRSSKCLKNINPCISLDSVSWELILYGLESHGRVLKLNLNTCVFDIDLLLRFQG
jgi:hypothetical protein